MKMMITLITALLMMGVCQNGHAGIFSSEPPKEILNSTVFVMSHHGPTSRAVALHELVSLFKKGGAVSWDKTGKDGWILRCAIKDDVTGKTGKMSWVFKKQDEKSVVLTRLNADGEEFLPANGVLLTLADQFLAPMIMAKSEKEGNANTGSKKSQQPSVKKEALKPPISFLSLKVSRPGDNHGPFEMGLITVSELFTHMKKSGAAQWTKIQRGEHDLSMDWVIQQKEKANSISIHLQEEDYYPAEVKDSTGAVKNATTLPIREAKIIKMTVNGKEQKSLADFYAEVTKASGRSVAGQK
ncbi:MAG: hypothetical protein AABZ06_05985 [Bdellovibrionota bacterium]